MILYPNAKINIGLNILFKRPDGFHEIDTLMYPIPLTDILTINKSKNTSQKLNFSTTGIQIDGNPHNNLIFKAYELILSKYKLPALDIHLHKSIPFGAGLGGGSADCAFAIKGINEICELDMPISQMEELAATLGSDCPFFIQNQPALATGRGEKLKQSDINLKAYTIALIIPPTPISTKAAYSLVKPFKPNIELNKLLKTPLNTWKNSIVNNFEDSVFPQFPEIETIKLDLYKKGAEYASLSGSGSAVFGIFEHPINFKDAFPSNYFVWHSQF